MKRTPLRLLTVLIFGGMVFVVMLLVFWQDHRAPFFVPGTPAIARTFGMVYFNSGGDAPFAGGRVWLWANSGTNTHQYLFDLERNVILGELFNAKFPQFCNQDFSRMLVTSQDVQPESLKQRAIDAINSAARRVTGEELFHPGYTDTVWVLNLTNNSATPLGEVTQHPRAGDRWHPSPDFKRAFTAPGLSVFLCDLEAGSLKEIAIGGSLVGWWDDHRLLVSNGTNQFDLFDVVTRTTTNLFNPGDIAALLASEGLSGDPFGLWATANWNGHDYDFFFTQDKVRYKNTFLLKADRASSSLKLLYRDFKSQISGCFDSTSTRYLYPGLSVSVDEDGAVYMRQLTNDMTITLVPPDSERNYSVTCFPRFHGNEVIYSRKGLLRRIELTGTNDVVLLPGSGP